MPESIHCPSCGAPLSSAGIHALALCAYCGCTVRLDPAGTSPQAMPDAVLNEAALAEVRQLVLDGRRDEAVAFYRDKTGVGQAEAAGVVDQLVGQLTIRALTRQPLSAKGIVIVLAVFLLGAGAVTGGILWNAVWLAIVGGLFLLFHALVFGAAIRARFLLALGSVASATVERVVQLGEIKVRSEAKPVAVLRLLLAVRPPGGAGFKHELNIPVGEVTLGKLHPGLVIEVRCDRRRRRVVPTMPLKVLGG